MLNFNNQAQIKTLHAPNVLRMQNFYGKMGKKTSFGGAMQNKSLPLYYKYTNNPREISADEAEFQANADDFATCKEKSKAQFVEEYAEFNAEVDENDAEKQVFMLSCLIEALDKSTSEEKSKLLFDMVEAVCAEYQKSSSVQDAMKLYATSDILKNNSVKKFIGIAAK